MWTQDENWSKYRPAEDEARSPAPLGAWVVHPTKVLCEDDLFVMITVPSKSYKIEDTTSLCQRASGSEDYEPDCVWVFSLNTKDMDEAHAAARRIVEEQEPDATSVRIMKCVEVAEIIL